VADTVAETQVPRSVRVAALIAVAVAVSGLLLIVAGILDLHWWGTSSAAGLRRVLAQVQTVYGTPPPALLRSGDGAVELIVLGVCCLPYAVLAPLILKGRQAARTAGTLLGIVTVIAALVLIGADSTTPVDLRSYLASLGVQGAGDAVPQIHALIYPGGYQWIEDIAQGLQALASLAVLVALVAAGIGNPYFFGGKGFFGSKDGASAPPDEWGAAISRIREQNARRRAETGLEE
jgi:hypothetical protein